MTDTAAIRGIRVAKALAEACDQPDLQKCLRDTAAIAEEQLLEAGKWRGLAEALEETKQQLPVLHAQFTALRKSMEEKLAEETRLRTLAEREAEQAVDAFEISEAALLAAITAEVADMPQEMQELTANNMRLIFANAQVTVARDRALEVIKHLMAALERIPGIAGAPDPAEACRNIIAEATEAIAWKEEYDGDR